MVLCRWLILRHLLRAISFAAHSGQVCTPVRLCFNRPSGLLFPLEIDFVAFQISDLVLSMFILPS